MITIEDSLRFKLDFEQEKSKNLFEELMEYKNKVAQLETKLAEANDYIDKINTIYQNEEIFVVKNGEGFYTDKFDSVIMTNIVAIQEQRK